MSFTRVGEKPPVLTTAELQGPVNVPPPSSSAPRFRDTLSSLAQEGTENEEETRLGQSCELLSHYCSRWLALRAIETLSDPPLTLTPEERTHLLSSSEFFQK